MKHFYLLFCVLSVSALQSQTINFPDVNFKAKLLQANADNLIAFDVNEQSMTIDTNGDGEIQLSEAQHVKGLDVQNSGISDLTGISDFPNLKVLVCSHNALTSLVIDDAIPIWILNASHNAISVFDVNFADSVDGMDMSYNNLTSFAVEGSIFWDYFNLSHNQLTSLSLSDVMLDYFNVSHNNLSGIEFSGQVRFTRSGDFSHNQFELLDFSEALFDYDATLQLGHNSEDTIWFSESSKPGNIHYSSDNVNFDTGNFHATGSCDPEYTGNVIISDSPNLQSISFKNGISHGYFTCNEGGTIFQNASLRLQISNCPNLNHICGDLPELPVIQSIVDAFGLQNQVTVDSVCTMALGPDAIADVLGVFRISPVPATDILRITTANDVVIENLFIANNLGQIVYEQAGDARAIDVSALAKGSYFLKAETANETFTKQFLKE